LPRPTPGDGQGLDQPIERIQLLFKRFHAAGRYVAVRRSQYTLAAPIRCGRSAIEPVPARQIDSCGNAAASVVRCVWHRDFAEIVRATLTDR
jgi:hypothetical protein